MFGLFYIKLLFAAVTSHLSTSLVLVCPFVRRNHTSVHRKFLASILFTFGSFFAESSGSFVQLNAVRLKENSRCLWFVENKQFGFVAGHCSLIFAKDLLHELDEHKIPQNLYS